MRQKWLGLGEKYYLFQALIFITLTFGCTQTFGDGGCHAAKRHAITRATHAYLGFVNLKRAARRQRQVIVADVEGDCIAMLWAPRAAPFAVLVLHRDVDFIRLTVHLIGVGAADQFRGQLARDVDPFVDQLECGLGGLSEF